MSRVCATEEHSQSSPSLFSIRFKELWISRQSTWSVSTGYLLFVNRETVQLPVAIPFKSHFKVESYYNNKCNYTVIGFSVEMKTLNFTLHQKVITMHLSRSPDSGPLSNNVGAILPSGLGAKGGQCCCRWICRVSVGVIALRGSAEMSWAKETRLGTNGRPRQCVFHFLQAYESLIRDRHYVGANVGKPNGNKLLFN